MNQSTITRNEFIEKIDGALAFIESLPQMKGYLTQPKTHPLLEWTMLKLAKPFFGIQHLHQIFWRIGFCLDWRGRYYARHHFLFGK